MLKIFKSGFFKILAWKTLLSEWLHWAVMEIKPRGVGANSEINPWDYIRGNVVCSFFFCSLKLSWALG